MDTRAAHALVRFGLGRLGAEPYPTDPRAWLLAQLQQPDRPHIDPPATTALGLQAMREQRDAKDGAGKSKPRQLYRIQGNAALEHAVTTTAPFRERLVWFWTNHFTISLRRGACAGVAGAYVEEAIRPHVTGRFEDMLLAVMRHPAMLIYLDNEKSVGPDSRLAGRGRRGLNENLARECLELHTVTPAAGYTQADVTAFAQVLTGWSIAYEADPPGFVFNASAHQPGPKTVMGRQYPEGEAGGIALLKVLASHPATYRSLATKLATHFVADQPPARAVGAIEAVLRDTGGNLGAAAAALVSLPEAWDNPGGKLRTPQELAIAAFRALGGPTAGSRDLLGVVAGLGQPLWTAPAPNGWPDQAEAWATPEGMMRRIDWTYAFAGRIGQRDPNEIAAHALGPFLRPATRDMVAGAGSRREAMTILLTSPEFQRR